MADVFISYHVASAAGVVRQIAEQLRGRGVTYWYSEGDMKPGFNFPQVAPREIEDCKVFLLILDEGAMNSFHVETELGLAVERIREISIIPFRVQEAPLQGWVKYYLKHIQIMNNRLTPPLDRRVAELADYIAQLLGKGPSVQASAPPTIQPSALWTPPAALWTRETLSAGTQHTVGLRRDGTVVTVGKNEWGDCRVSDWRDIAAVSAGEWHTVGLRKDGSVVAKGDLFHGQCNVSDWRGIVAVSAGTLHTVGLRKDGTVVAVGENEDGQCNVSDWRDIVAVSAGYWNTGGVRKDGTIVAVGKNIYGQCNVSGWKGIAAVSFEAFYTVGLRRDGTVVTVGKEVVGPEAHNTAKWRNIVAISSGWIYTVGLRKDGTVVAIGGNYDGQCNVSDWRDIQLP